jgi:hypothetical protein
MTHISKEWCLKMAELEEGYEVGVGFMDRETLVELVRRNSEEVSKLSESS